MSFRLLGPLEVVHDGEIREVPSGRQQALLAALLLRPGEVVSAPTLVEQVWGDNADRTVLNVCVMRLRRSLHDPDHDLIRADGNGYRVAVDPETVDLHRFRRLCARAGEFRDAGDRERERDMLREALALWRGEAFAGIGSPILRSEVVLILEEERLAAIESRIDADLDCGAHTEVIRELRQLVAEHPFRERFWCQLLLALYRCGRQSDALAAYQVARRGLTDELGVEPGDELRRLHHRILTADPSLPARRAETAPTPQVVPAQLPSTIAGFSGRRDQLGQLDRLLDGPEPVPATLVTGAPGVGKTALTVHWASRNRDRWPDGQLYIDLRGYGPGAAVGPVEALAYFLRAIGVPGDQVPGDVAQASAQFRSLTADRRMLILLDNAATPRQVRPLLPGGPGCLVIVTSRDRLTGLTVQEGAQRLPLDVMADTEARTLLNDTVCDARLAAEPGVVAELARLCGNLPLALRITAADLLGHPRRSLADHLTGLRTGNRLDALQVAEDNGTAVRATFRFSYARLDPPLRRMFRLLGLFPGPQIGVEAAAALADVEPETAGRLLDRLVSAHLVMPRGPDGFALHDLLRLFAAELAAAEEPETERAQAIQRLYDHYFRCTDAAAKLMYSMVVLLPLRPEAARLPVGFDSDTTAAQWLDAELPNLVAAVRDAAGRGAHLDACRLAVALYSYLSTRLHVVDWLSVVSTCLHAAREIGHPRAQILSHLSLGHLHRVRTQHRAAVKHFEQAMVLCRHHGWIGGQATVHNNLSGVYDSEGNLRLTVEHLDRALEIVRKTADSPTSEAIILGNLGRVLLRLGRIDEAVAHLERATNLHHRLGARVSEARSRASLGEAIGVRGEHEYALALLDQAITVQRELDDRMYLPNTLGRLALAHLDLGQYGPAAEVAASGLALAREYGHRRSETWTTFVLAKVEERCGRYDRALDHFDQAWRLSRDQGSGYLNTQTAIGLGVVHRELGRRARARQHLDKALAVSRRFGYRLLERQAVAALDALSTPADPR